VDPPLHQHSRRRQGAFRPSRPPRVGVYVCGRRLRRKRMWSTHVRHRLRRPATASDLARFRGHILRNIRTLTNKIIAGQRARVDPANRRRAVHRRYDDRWRARRLPRTSHQRASGHIPRCRPHPRLVEADFAYAGEGACTIGRAFKEYGSFPGAASTSSRTRTRRAAPGKRHPLDFALWKAAKGTNRGGVAWGRTRDGTSSAPAFARYSTGRSTSTAAAGPDLPPSENEIAQSEALGTNPSRTLAAQRHVNIGGRESKSLRNYVMIEMRCGLRQQRDALLLLRRATTLADDTERCAGRSESGVGTLPVLPARCTSGGRRPDAKRSAARFGDAMDDDLNTPAHSPHYTRRRGRSRETSTSARRALGGPRIASRSDTHVSARTSRHR